MKRTPTIDLKGKEYAQVKDRISEFRKECPHGLIETTPITVQTDQIVFKARVLKDKADQNSAEATGHSLGENKGAKAFEKLETIAVGRALALLGYATSGEIASSEEMEEFYAYKEEKKRVRVEQFSDELKEAKTIDELQKVWASVDGALKPDLQVIKDIQKQKLNETN